MENSMQILKKLKIQLLYDPAISLLDIYPKVVFVFNLDILERESQRKPKPQGLLS